MKNDFDVNLYEEYLNGKTEAFEYLYNKYKDKLKYFIFNIVNDYQKAEDIMQDVFIYVLQNKPRKDCSFKFYLYLVARSRAINYKNSERNKNEIYKKYFSEKEKSVYQDVAEIAEKNEKMKEILNSINMLDERYRDALYLVKIEELSIQETAEIMGESVQNVKNLVYRGKKELRKILIKKGFDEMNKVLKVMLIGIIIAGILSGGVYAVKRIVEKFSGKVEMTPTFTSGISTMDTNKVWVGTFNLVWNDFMNEVVKGKIEFEDGESELANELNKQNFTVKELSENSYFKIHGKTSYDLKYKIENGIKEKFNEESKIIERANWDIKNSYILYAMLKKEFEFLEPFETLGNYKFNNSEENVKYFGLDMGRPNKGRVNVEVLFFNNVNDFAIKLKTKQGEEVYLYKTTGENKSFEENFEEMMKKSKEYTGEKECRENDYLSVPYINLSAEINYDELCGRIIKGTQGMYIGQALQTIDFELNNTGGSVKSEALMQVLQKGGMIGGRDFRFNSDFILYLKEENKDKPYFALKVDDTDVLVEEEN